MFSCLITILCILNEDEKHSTYHTQNGQIEKQIITNGIDQYKLIRHKLYLNTSNLPHKKKRMKAINIKTLS